MDLFADGRDEHMSGIAHALRYAWIVYFSVSETDIR
jgi:hypothetical protein